MMRFSFTGPRPKAGLALALPAAVLAVLSARPAQATVFEVDATGIITQVTSGPNYTLSQASLGQSITFHYLFDTSATGHNQSSGSTAAESYTPSDPTAANYGPTAQFGGYSVTPVISGRASVTVSVSNSTATPYDVVNLVGYGLSVNGVGNQGEAFLSLQDPTGVALSSTQLPPPSAYTLTNFPVAGFYFTPDSGDGAADRSTISGSVTSLSATDVSSAPEPSQIAMLSLLGLGLGGLLLRARKRAKRA